MGPKKMRLRRSASLMIHDPYTLVVALDNSQQASGMLYMDDEKSFDYQKKGQFRLQQFTWSNNVLSAAAAATSAPASKEYQPSNTLERVIAVGLKSPPKSVSVNDAQEPAISC